jgi:hypothetical protein
VFGAGRFGVLIMVKANDFSSLQNVQTGYGAPLGVKRSGRENHSHLDLRLRMSGAIPLFLLYAFVAWTRKTLPFLSEDLLASLQGNYSM